MAIRFTDKAPDAPPSKRDAAREDDARAQGEARFATPIEADAPVNPDAAGKLPFSDLPEMEKGAKRKRAPKGAPRP